MKERAIEASKLLNQFLGDLSATTQALLLFESHSHFPKLSVESRLSLRRMCLSHLIVTLSKWHELYKHYKNVFPKDIENTLKALYKKIKTIGIIDFRNSVVGHIWHDKLNRPLSSSEVEKLLKDIYNDLEIFIKWIDNPENNKFPNTVTSICEHLRNKIMDNYKIAPEEILK